MAEIITPEVKVKEPALAQADAAFKNRSAAPTMRCGLCKYYSGDGACDLVVAEPNPITENAVCDQFDSRNAEVDVTKDVVVVPEQSAVRDCVIAEQAETTGKGYVYLKVRYMWEVERIQSALATIFGYDEGWRWLDPYTYHVTLAYSEDVTNDQLLEVVKVVAGMDAIDLRITGIDSFETPNGERAVYLNVEKNEALVALQQAVYDSLNGQGVSLSPFSEPGSWVPHLTLAYAPVGTSVPASTIDVTVYSDDVCIARTDYKTLAEVKLEWKQPDNAGEDGSGPVQEMASWKVGVASDLTVGDDVDWDGAAAAKSVFDAAGFGGDNPDTALARKAFLIYNASAPKLKGSYKLPIAKWSGDKLVVVPAGLRNAASRLPQVKGVPKAVMDRAGKALSAYKKKAGIGEMNETPSAHDGKELIRLVMISEMKGAYPDIPLPDDIDRDALKEIVGDKLFYVTLPIGEADAMSRNGRKYSRRAVEQIVEYVNKDRPDGIWGHMSTEEIQTRYDPPSIRWLAAMMDADGIAWGKGLPLNEETRNYYQLARATKAKVGTSIMAWASMDDDEVVELDLQQVDIADPKRVGVPATAAVPHLTAEMTSGSGESPKRLKDGDSLDVIERAARDATAAAPVPKITQSETPVVEMRETKPDKEESTMDEKEIQELVSERDTLKSQVTELQGNATRVTELETKVKELSDQVGMMLREYIDTASARACSVDPTLDLTDEDAVAVRPSYVSVRDYVVAMQPQSKEAVDAAVKKVIERPHIKEMLKNELKESNPKLDNLFEDVKNGQSPFYIPSARQTKEA